MHYATYFSVNLLVGAISAFPLETSPILQRTVNSFKSLSNSNGIPYFGNENGNFQSANNEISTLALDEQVTGPLAVTAINNNDGIGSGSDSYKRYSGGGSLGEGWPAKTQWVSFSNMFANNKDLMFGSCEWNNWGPRDTAAEIDAIYNAIQQIALNTKVDHRLILAVIMQESGGCVRAPTTNNGVRNPGLMQSHNGAGTCNDNGNIQSPCPSSTITQMIKDGAGGTSSGEGLAGAINRAGTGVRGYYVAARLYNSGSVNNANLNDGLGARPCYVMDIANRLTGWTWAAQNCGL